MRWMRRWIRPASGDMLRELSEGGAARVLVGSRRSPDGRVMPGLEERHQRLRALFGETALIVDLEDEQDTAGDIAAYVRARLADSKHREDRAGIELVSERSGPAGRRPLPVRSRRRTFVAGCAGPS